MKVCPSLAIQKREMGCQKVTVVSETASDFNVLEEEKEY